MACSLSLLGVLFCLSVTFSIGLLINEDKSKASMQACEGQYIKYGICPSKPDCKKGRLCVINANSTGMCSKMHIYVRQINNVGKEVQYIYRSNQQGFQCTHNFKLLSYISLDVQQEDLSKMRA